MTICRSIILLLNLEQTITSNYFNKLQTTNKIQTDTHSSENRKTHKKIVKGIQLNYVLGK